MAHLTNTTLYSHGLEKIYSLENVDSSSIKPIGETKLIAMPPTMACQAFTYQHSSVDQAELDFGAAFRLSVRPFIFDEPIQWLGLSSHSEKCLKEHRLLKIKDVIGIDVKDFVYYKGLGQGHIEEICQKVNVYLAGRNTLPSIYVDFASWLRVLIGTADRKKVHFLLEPYGLNGLVTLTPAENVEIRRVSETTAKEWKEEAREPLLKQKVYVESGFKEIVDALIKPWVALRHGFVDQFELQERIEQVSVDAAIASKVLKLLQELFFEGFCPVRSEFREVQPGIFCGDSRIEKRFRGSLRVLESYFYSENVVYDLDELVSLTERELAVDWYALPEGFLAKVLRYSPSFTVTRTHNGQLTVEMPCRQDGLE